MDAAVLSACVSVTLVACRAAFLHPRTFIPSQAVFADWLIVPASWRQAWWLLCGVICLFQNVHGLAVWGLATLLLDRYIWSPHLVHFTVLAASFALSSTPAFWIDTFAVALYTFAGLQKLNGTFLRGFVANVPGPLVFNLTGVRLRRMVSRRVQFGLGVAAALSEAAMGLLLLTHRRTAYALIAALHVTILLCFGPLGRSQFSGIWGWNLWCLYYAARAAMSHADVPILAAQLWAARTDLRVVAFVAVFTVTPALSMLCHVGERLSFKMHSENTMDFVFHVPRAATYPPELHKYLVRDEGDSNPSHMLLLVDDYIRDTAYLMPALSDRTARSLARLLEQRIPVAAVAVSRAPAAD